jgi:hypothetical protein
LREAEKEERRIQLQEQRLAELRAKEEDARTPDHERLRPRRVLDVD